MQVPDKKCDAIRDSQCIRSNQRHLLRTQRQSILHEVKGNQYNKEKNVIVCNNIEYYSLINFTIVRNITIDAMITALLSKDINDMEVETV